MKIVIPTSIGLTIRYAVTSSDFVQQNYIEKRLNLHLFSIHSDCIGTLELTVERAIVFLSPLKPDLHSREDLLFNSGIN
ncbi:hypothetical protein QWY90_07265 [Flavobacterium paronense]|uniref:Uncharacterized protein n=1 Tax=Flavobacterium paronense TaxID=1392775 RepID=A0ABV5GGP9_9FLAO|nr:hypothetical protein [Flavobacterium paronense]MDN3677109.1 hypothetical protein [Flavobacterium paronense]